MPSATLGIHLRVSRLLNLTRSGSRWQQSRSQLHIPRRSDRELTQPWAGVPHAPTQVLGNQVFGDGFFEGILYPSAQNVGHSCVVLFRSRLLPTSLVDFHDAATGLTAQLP